MPVTPAHAPRTVATHDGPFHADDLVAVTLLALAHPTHQMAVIRTRDPVRLAQADLRVDVGGVHDPAAGTFDHHFIGAPVRAGHNGIPYASTGLVWQHLGPRLLTSRHPDLPGPVRDRLVALLDDTLFAPLDAIDTGAHAGPIPETHLSAVLLDCNLPWPELTGEPLAVAQAVDRRFADIRHKVARRLTHLLTTVVGFPLDAELPVRVRRAVAHTTEALARDVAAERAATQAAAVAGRSVVEAAMAARGAGTTLLVLPHAGLPWEDVVHALEGAHPVVHVLEPGIDGHLYVTCVPTEPGGFTSRAPFPEAWAGLRGEAFSAASGIADGVFCHPARFIAGWTTAVSARRGALIAERAARGITTILPRPRS